MAKCPFLDDDFILPVDEACPVCGKLGSFIYKHPTDNSCIGWGDEQRPMPPDVSEVGKGASNG